MNAWQTTTALDKPVLPGSLCSAESLQMSQAFMEEDCNFCFFAQTKMKNFHGRQKNNMPVVFSHAICRFIFVEWKTKQVFSEAYLGECLIVFVCLLVRDKCCVFLSEATQNKYMSWFWHHNLP